MGLFSWSRKHGTYRPTLAKQVASNSVAEIRKATRDGFAIYESNHADYAKAVTTISKLKGVGPATASLFLSCYDPDNVPFFSDELYRYLHWEEAKSKGWDRKIGYTMKEYKELYDQLQTLRERLEKESGQKVAAIDVEKMAYSLGKSVQHTSTLGKRENDDDYTKELRPPSSKKRRKANPPPSQRPIEICRRKGPFGSPTYDELGFELDYEYISKCTGGRPRPLGKGALARLDQKQREKEKKRELMDATRLDDTTYLEQAMDDRVAKDLNMAYHEVGIKEYEQWHAKGFRRQKGELENLSDAEKDRLMDLMSGSALRKGSKHR